MTTRHITPQDLIEAKIERERLRSLQLGNFVLPQRSPRKRPPPPVNPLMTSEAVEAIARRLEESNHVLCHHWREGKWQDPLPAGPVIRDFDGETKQRRPNLWISDFRAREGWTAPIGYERFDQQPAKLPGPDMSGDDVARDLTNEELRAWREANR